MFAEPNRFHLYLSRRDAVALSCLLLAQLSAYILINAGGGFPVNDDWAYALSVQWWFDEGRLRLCNWIAMNLLPQTLLGSAVSAVFGFSFDVLRHLTQALALLTGVFLFLWFRTLSLGTGASLLASLLIIATPWWMVLANSYMTEFYALVFILPGLALYASLLSPAKRFSCGVWALATALLIVAVLQRQTALVFPVAFGIAYGWRARKFDAPTLTIAVLPAVLAVAAELTYRHYLETGPGIPEAQQGIHQRLMPLLMNLLAGDKHHMTWLGVKAAALIGDLALGSALWCIACWFRQRWRLAPAVIVLAAIFLLACAALQWWPPYHENNVLDRLGIGPLTVKGGMIDAYGANKTPSAFWVGAGVLACVGAAIFTVFGVRAAWQEMRRWRQADPQTVFLVVALAGYFTPFLIADFFDRYVFFVLPLFYGLLARIMQPDAAQNEKASPGRRTATAILCAGTMAAGALSIAAAHDYFAWQNARWIAVGKAEALGGTAMTIDGGFEYNGFHRYEARGGKAVPGKSWWWVDDDEYVVTLWPIPGYRIVETLPIDRWLPGSPPDMFLLRRDPPSGASRNAP